MVLRLKIEMRIEAHPIGDGKCADAIETRGVADAWACRVVTGVSTTGEVASDEWLVARGK